MTNQKSYRVTFNNPHNLIPIYSNVSYVVRAQGSDCVITFGYADPYSSPINKTEDELQATSIARIVCDLESIKDLQNSLKGVVEQIESELNKE